MSDKIIKLTPVILKKIIEEERKTLAKQAEKVKNASKQELIAEIKNLVNLRTKQKYLIKRLRSITEQRKNITKTILKRRS
jgi:hypothetical protein